MTNVVYTVLLPNLLFKNNSIYFITERQESIKVINNLETYNDIEVDDPHYSGNIYFMDNSINYDIIKEENKNGLSINIKINKDCYMTTIDIQKTARLIEGYIVGIDLLDETYNTKYEDEIFNIYSSKKNKKSNDNLYIETDNYDEDF
jgi:hypothetical protein